MLYKILLFLLVVDSVVLLAAILMQAGQGGGLAATFRRRQQFGRIHLWHPADRESAHQGLAGGAAGCSSRSPSCSRSRRRGSASPQSVLDNAFQNPPASAPAPLGSGETSGAVPLQTAPTTTQPAAPATKTPPTDTKKKP